MRKNKLAIVILAAGKGTRLKSNLAKALHTIAGKSLLELAVEKALNLLPEKIIVIVGFQKEKLIKSLKKYKGIVTVEQKKLLGTADAIKSTRNVLRNFNGTTLISYVDMPLVKQETLKTLIDFHKKNLNDCTILTAKVERPYGFGRIMHSDSGEICAIVEDKELKPKDEAINEINTGIICFKNNILFKYIDKIKLNPNKKEFYLTDIINILYLDNFKVGGFLASGSEAIGINSNLDLIKARQAHRMQVIYGFIEKGIDIIHPDTTFIEEDTKIGKDTKIYPFTVIERNVKIGNNCRVGPFCHLRPGTILENNVQVGNFTEINRSHINKHTLVKHFGYIGDARIGKNVNIGAGAVTANYDGVNKNKTEICDDVFIGSDSILVAPVKVAKHAITGAGSVVTKDVKEKQVVVGVPARPVLRRAGR